MSYADEVFIKNCKDILENGFSTENEKVRPVWEDGTPAYTIKKFGVVNRYDLSKEFPILTLRYTNWKAAIDEMLWIWQKKSNRVEAVSYTHLGTLAVSPKYTMFSLGSALRISFATVSPPTPESNIPIGLLSIIYLLSLIHI